MRATHSRSVRAAASPAGARLCGALWLLCGTVALLCGTAPTTATAATAAAAATPAKDTFAGRITTATGKLHGDGGRVTALLHITPSAAPVRKLELTLQGAPCAGTALCLRLSGVLSGTISAHRATIPDAGRQYALALSGHLAALGRVVARGTVAGVGFIRQGHESLTLALRTSAGELLISAASPKVPGFTSP